MGRAAVLLYVLSLTFHGGVGVLARCQGVPKAPHTGRYGIKLAVFGMHELFYAGVEPNKKLFKRFGCWDKGVQYGG